MYVGLQMGWDLEEYWPPGRKLHLIRLEIMKLRTLMQSEKRTEEIKDKFKDESINHLNLSE